MSLGPVLAGSAVAALGSAAAMAIDGASFVAAGVLLACGRAAAPPEHARVSIRAAVARVRRAGTIPALLVVDGATAVCFALIIPVELVFVTDTLGGSEADFGLVLAAWGAGGVLGGFALRLLRRLDPGVVLLAGFALMVTGYLGMGVANGIVMVTACSLLGGVGQGLEGCALLTAVQRRTPREIQAHVNALTEAIHAAAPGIGFALGGVLAATVTPRVTYVVAGLSALAVVVASVTTLSDAVADNAAPVAVAV